MLRNHQSQNDIGGQRGAVSGASKQTIYAFVYWSVRRYTSEWIISVCMLGEA
jgi:hypothetical protein